MTTQRVIWTACPNGTAPNGNLRISVAIGPQLMPTGTGATLSAFPDWEDWPATQITWKATIGTDVVDATVVSAAPSSALYTALFLPTTPVAAYQYQSPTANALYTYPAATLRQFFAGLYTGLAKALPEGGGWHGWQEIVSDGSFGVLPLNGREMQDAIDQVLSAFPKGGGPIASSSLSGPRAGVTQAYMFLQPRTEPPPYPTVAGQVPPPVPQFDFHEAYSLLQRHPALLRLFGFVVDLEVAAPAGLAATVPLSVTPTWRPKLANPVGVSFIRSNTTNVTPVTMTTSATWLAEPRTTSPEIADGLLRLSDPGAYQVIEVDLDGASVKALNFVQNVWNAQFVMRSADTPSTYAVPSLRSAGLSLSKVGQASSLYQNWLNNNAFNTALSSTPPGPITLYAEDIAQGWRFDVHDAAQAKWYSLCARTGTPNPPGIGGYGVGSPQTVVPVPSGDEGWIEPAPTQPASSSSPPSMYLPETLTRWSGWSLVAPRPGKHIDDASDDSLVDDAGNPPPPGSNFQLQIEYAATPGTLPTLRFGRVYRFRARVVDLAGNSVPFASNAPLAYATPPAVYGRVEPVASPVVVPCAPRTPGESLETIVIRSNYDIADSSPLIVPAERHLAPPASSEDMVEAHGALDGANGAPQASLYSLIAGRDGLTYKSASVMSLYGGDVDTQPLNGSNEWVYYPPVTTPSSSQPAFGVPYLPDVLGAGVSLLGLPGAPFKRVNLAFDSVGPWPARRALRLVVRAGHAAPSKPPPGELDGELTVYAPKASVSTVRLSSWFRPAQLASMKLWQWLSEAGLATAELDAVILLGGHYMFTPYRELTIVHAVRQPLDAPWANILAPFRTAGATYIYLNGDVRADPKSTQRVDVLSFYVDPYDDGVSLDGIVLLENKARVAEIPLAADASAIIPVKDMRHDFNDTKHHEVFYNLVSTTRFLEYFTETTTVKLSGTAAVVVSPKRFAAGTVVVMGTGAAVSATYKDGVDFVEDDTAGSIARTATTTALDLPEGAMLGDELNAGTADTVFEGATLGWEGEHATKSVSITEYGTTFRVTANGMTAERHMIHIANESFPSALFLQYGDGNGPVRNGAARTLSVTHASPNAVNPALNAKARLIYTDENGAPLPVEIIFQKDVEIAAAAPAQGDPASPIFIQNRTAYLVNGRGTLSLAPGDYELVVTHGPTHTLLTEKVTLRANETTNASGMLRRVVDTSGWTSADFHLHAQPSADSAVSLDARVTALASVGVDFAVATDHNRVTDYAPVISQLGLQNRLESMRGVELTTPALGHFGAYPMNAPTGAPELSTPLYYDVSPKEALASAREFGARVIQVNHARMPPAIGYLDQTGFDSANGTSKSAFADGFDAMEVHNGFWLEHPDRVREGAADLVGLARRGLHIAALGNSDSHRLFFEEAGWPRTYVKTGVALGGGASLGELILRGILRGETTVSAGPFVEMTVAGQPIGSTVTLKSKDAKTVRVHVRVQAPAWIPVEHIEIHVDDATVKTWDATSADDGVRFEGDADIPIDRDCVIYAWVDADKPIDRVMARAGVRAIGMTGLVYVDRDADGKVTLAPRASK